MGAVGMMRVVVPALAGLGEGGGSGRRATQKVLGEWVLTFVPEWKPVAV